MMLKTMRKHGITLALFAAGSTELTAAISELTKNTIDQQAALQQKTLLDQVLLADHYNNDLLKSCYLINTPALDKGQHKVWMAKNNDQPIGAVMETTTPGGYSGTIQLLVAADFSGTVLSTRMTEHHEAPDLGDKIELRLSDWITRFIGKVIHGQDNSHWAIKKDGGGFDQFIGTTITLQAVVNAVKCANLYTQTLSAQLPEFTACGE